MLVGSAPASLLGVWAATYLTDRYGDSVDSVQGRVLGFTLLIGAISFVAKALLHKGPTSGMSRLTNRDRIVAVAIGVGRVHRRSHLGRERDALRAGNALRLPVGRQVRRRHRHRPRRRAPLIAGLGHLVAGNVDVPAISWLLVGSIPGVLIGSQISVGLPERVLRLALASVLALSGLKLLDVPYANTIVVVSLVLGLMLLAGWGVAVLIARRGRREEEPAVGPSVRPVSEPPATAATQTPERRS